MPDRQTKGGVCHSRAGTLEGEVEAALGEIGGRTGVGLLSEGLEAFALRALSARAARHRLDLQYYLWHDDVTGRLLGDEVLAAADRGVRVRLLLDDSYALGADRSLAALDSHPSVEVRLFNATGARWRSWGRLGLALEFALGGWHLNHRMHNKAWIVDDRLAILGGRNIGDAYFDAADAFNFRDLDLVVAGENAAQAAAVFERYWDSPLARPVADFAAARGGRAADGLPGLRLALAAAGGSEEARPYLQRVRDRATVFRLLCGAHCWVPTDAVRVLADPPEKATGRHGRGGNDGLASIIRAALGGAACEALLISPYFVPGERGTELLVGLARRGVRVSVVTNSLAATDVVAVHGGYARYRRPLLEAGVAIHELRRSGREDAGVFGSRGASLHTKAFAVDGELAFVGSFNLDPRSANLNTEMGAFVRHPELARRLRAEHDRLADPARSYGVELDGRGGLVWTGGAGDEGRRIWHGEPEASPARRLLARVVGLLPIESQL